MNVNESWFPFVEQQQQEGEEESFVESVEEGEGGGAVTETEPKLKTTPPDDLRAAMTELAGIVKQQSTKAEPQKEATQDEIDEYWALWKPEKKDPDFLRKFLRLQTDMTPDEVTKAVKEFTPIFDELRNGLTKQAVIGAQRLFQQELAKFKEEYEPVKSYVSEAKAERTKTRFYDAYPALVGRDKVIKNQASALASQKFDSEESYFKALAEGAAEAIKEVLPEFDLGVVQPKPKSAVTSPRLPRTSVGGTGGAGGGTGSGPKKVASDDSESIDWTAAS